MECCVPHCTSKKIQSNSTTSFHQFPLTGQLREEWVNVLKVDPRVSGGSGFVCSLHFRPGDYTGGEGRKKLSHDAIPSKIPRCLCTKGSMCLLWDNKFRLPKKVRTSPIKPKKAEISTPPKIGKVNFPKVLLKRLDQPKGIYEFVINNGKILTRNSVDKSKNFDDHVKRENAVAKKRTAPRMKPVVCSRQFLEGLNELDHLEEKQLVSPVISNMKRSNLKRKISNIEEYNNEASKTMKGKKRMKIPSDNEKLLEDLIGNEDCDESISVIAKSALESANLPSEKFVVKSRKSGSDQLISEDRPNTIDEVLGKLAIMFAEEEQGQAEEVYTEEHELIEVTFIRDENMLRTEDLVSKSNNKHIEENSPVKNEDFVEESVHLSNVTTTFTDQDIKVMGSKEVKEITKQDEGSAKLPRRVGRPKKVTPNVLRKRQDSDASKSKSESESETSKQEIIGRGNQIDRKKSQEKGDKSNYCELIELCTEESKEPVKTEDISKEEEFSAARTKPLVKRKTNNLLSILEARKAAEGEKTGTKTSEVLPIEVNDERPVSTTDDVIDVTQGEKVKSKVPRKEKIVTREIPDEIVEVVARDDVFDAREEKLKSKASRKTNIATIQNLDEIDKVTIDDNTQGEKVKPKVPRKAKIVTREIPEEMEDVTIIAETSGKGRTNAKLESGEMEPIGPSSEVSSVFSVKQEKIPEGDGDINITENIPSTESTEEILTKKFVTNASKYNLKGKLQGTTSRRSKLNVINSKTSPSKRFPIIGKRTRRSSSRMSAQNKILNRRTRGNLVKQLAKKTVKRAIASRIVQKKEQQTKRKVKSPLPDKRNSGSHEVTEIKHEQPLQKSVGKKITKNQILKGKPETVHNSIMSLSLESMLQTLKPLKVVLDKHEISSKIPNETQIPDLTPDASSDSATYLYEDSCNVNLDGITEASSEMGQVNLEKAHMLEKKLKHLEQVVHKVCSAMSNPFYLKLSIIHNDAINLKNPEAAELLRKIENYETSGREG